MLSGHCAFFSYYHFIKGLFPVHCNPLTRQKLFSSLDKNKLTLVVQNRVVNNRAEKINRQRTYRYLKATKIAYNDHHISAQNYMFITNTQKSLHNKILIAPKERKKQLSRMISSV